MPEFKSIYSVQAFGILEDARMLRRLVLQLAKHKFVHCVVCDGKIGPGYSPCQILLRITKDDDGAGSECAVCEHCSSKYETEIELLTAAGQQLCERGIIPDGRVITINEQSGSA